MALTDLASVKEYLGITGTGEDGLLSTLINQATAIINQYCLRTLEAADYTEYYEGNGRPELPLRNYPVNSITSIHVDDGGYYGQGSDPFPSTSALTVGTDYTWKSTSGIVYRIGGIWKAIQFRTGSDLVGQQLPGFGNIKVVYNAGYSTVPEELILAANMMVASLKRTAGGGGTFKSESLEYYSYTLADNEEQLSVIGSIKSILSRFRKKIIF